MALAARMEKMVSFRLSEEEYQQFLDLCKASHARSVSEVARTAMHHLLERGPVNGGEEQMNRKLEELEERVARLTAEVEWLQKRA